MRKAAFTLFGLLLWLPLRAPAGPCIDCDGNGSYEFQWRYDRPIPLQVGDATGQPDVAWPNFAPDKLLVTWSASNPAVPGGSDIWLAISNDGGCHWDTRNLSTNPGDEVDPAIAVDDAGRCVAIVYTVRTNTAWDTGSIYALVSSDGGATFGPPQKLSTGPTDGAARAPDVAVTPGQMAPHFHAVWQRHSENGPAVQDAVFYKRNLGLCATPALSWQGAGSPPPPDETRLSTGNTLDGCNLSNAQSRHPHVSADTASSRPFVDSAVSVVWQSQCGSTTSTYFTRSNDSGNTFFGREAAPQSQPPLKIDESPGTARGRADIDTSDAGMGARNWNPVVWPSAGSLSNRLVMDAQSQAGSAINSDWNLTDVTVGSVAQPDTTEPAIASWGGSTGFAEAAFLVFWAPQVAANPDIDFHAGAMVLGALPNIVLGCPGVLPTTLTGLSPDPRSAGAASLPSAEENGRGDVVVVWKDTRNSPTGQVFFKRTDRAAPAAPTGVSAVLRVCPDNDVDVTFTASTSCDVAVYHVTTSEPTIPPVQVAPPATAATLVVPDGLRDVPITITVTAEDQACNRTAATPVTVTLTPRCPVLAAGTLAYAVSCNGNPDNDGEPDPGETVSLTLPVTNGAGTADATGVVGTLSVTSPPTGVSLLARVSAYPDMPAGSTAAHNNLTPFRVLLDPGLACPGTVQLRLDLATNQEPASLSYSFDFGRNGCDGNCIPACNAGAILPIRELLGVKAPNQMDARFQWQGDGQAKDGYNLAYVKMKQQIPACGAGCPGSLLVPLCDPTGSQGAVSCNHAGAVTNLAEPRHFYNVRGVCQGVEAAE